MGVSALELNGGVNALELIGGVNALELNEGLCSEDYGPVLAGRLYCEGVKGPLLLSPPLQWD
jgi:hypothetical protein